ncbi:MAG: sugar transferase [Bacteroidales bacterium]|nr:sugar transferase [Bacteroidales bacterium]
MSTPGHAVKHLFDLVVSGILMVVFAPLAAICALAVKLGDGGPVIYAQERIGLHGKPFKIYKFRTMRTDAELAGEPALAEGEEDPRLTRVGRFLRAHHLDELPQLWNVFKGDMSFIGYRPERSYYINQIMARNPRYRFLYQMRPGITSYATLYNGYTSTLEKMLVRLEMDLYYLRTRSVWTDLHVLGLTFLRIVAGKRF